jgi:hypothetical protein
MKTACIGTRPQNINISQQPLVRCHSNFKLKLSGQKQSSQWYHMKTTCIGRQPENTKYDISQQPLVGSYQHFKLELLAQVRPLPGRNQLIQLVVNISIILVYSIKI